MTDPTNLRKGSSGIRLPAIVSDIDGVVYSGGELTGSSPEVVSEILSRRWRGTAGKTLPFVFLTNGGMQSETEKMEYLNGKLGLAKYQREHGYDHVELLQEHHIIMCHTPLGE